MINRLLQQLESYYWERDSAKRIVYWLGKVVIQSHDVLIHIFHYWAYMFLFCFTSFFGVLMIGKLLSLVVHIPSKAIHSESATCKRQSERLWRTILLQLNMLISFPTFSQVWSLGLFLIIFFQEGKFAKTLLLIYYIHLFTDQSPTKSGWDEDASWLACLLGFGGQHKPGEKRSLIHRVIGFGFPFRSLCRRAYNFRLVREYFDAELIRTTELKETSTRNYMFLYHPHGIMAIGASALLCTDAAGFPQLFPGIHRSTCVLNACFLVSVTMFS